MSNYYYTITKEDLIGKEETKNIIISKSQTFDEVLSKVIEDSYSRAKTINGVKQ